MVSIPSSIHDNHKRGPVGVFFWGKPALFAPSTLTGMSKKPSRLWMDVSKLAKRLKQKQVAKECADWIRSRVNV
jgi:hypothetical protein